MKSIAAILTEPNTALSLREIEWQPLQYGQCLVRIIASGICGAQLQEIRGEKGNHFPRLLGHEACGEIVEVGPCVKTVSVGDRAVCHWRKGDGIESEPPKWGCREMGNDSFTAGQITTFSNYSIISENRLTAVPKETPAGLCSLLGCALSTALGTIENEVNLKIGESVLIIGCGGLGLNLIAAAKLRQADHIVAMDVVDKHETAFEMGATAFWNTRTKRSRLAQKLHTAFCEDWPYDVVIDTSGNPSAIELGLSKLAPSGRFVMVGQPKPGESITLANARHFFEGEGKSFTATQGGGFRPSADILRYVWAHRSGRLNFRSILTHSFPLSKINEALDLVRNGQAGRVLIEMDELP